MSRRMVAAALRAAWIFFPALASAPAAVPDAGTPHHPPPGRSLAPGRAFAAKATAGGRPRPGPGAWPPAPRLAPAEGLSLLQTSKRKVRGQAREATDLAQAKDQEAAADAGVPATMSDLMVTIAGLPGRAYDHIAVNVPYHDAWGELTTFPERRPRAFNLVLATVKTWSADAIVQLSSKQHRFDWKRSATFAIFGFIYIGLVQWFFYISVFTRVCPHAIAFANQPISEKLVDRPGQVDLLKQVLLDNFILESLIYFPIFYSIKEVLLLGGSKAMGTSITSGLAAYRDNFLQDNLASWAVWIPADLLIFAAPMWLRMPLDHSVSWLWTMFLSYMRGGTRDCGRDVK